MYGLAVSVYLIQTAGKENRTVQTAVEGTQVVDIVVFYLYLTQGLVPGVTSISHYIVKASIANLLQITFCLLQADE